MTAPEVRFVINGRELTADFISTPAGLLYKLLQEAVAERLRALRCPTHGEPPTVIGQGSSPDMLEWKIEGCCDSLREAALKAFISQP